MLIYSFNLDLINCAAICFLPYLLGESPEYSFDKAFKKSKSNQSRIVVVRTDFTTYDCITNEECAFDIKTEDTTICRCNNFVQGFPVIIALHCVFNVTYSKLVEATITFIQRMWPEIKDNQKIPLKVLCLICHIRKFCFWL